MSFVRPDALPLLLIAPLIAPLDPADLGLPTKETDAQDEDKESE